MKVGLNWSSKLQILHFEASTGSVYWFKMINLIKTIEGHHKLSFETTCSDVWSFLDFQKARLCQNRAKIRPQKMPQYDPTAMKVVSNENFWGHKIFSFIKLQFLQFPTLICIILTTVLASQKPQIDQTLMQMVSIKAWGVPHSALVRDFNWWVPDLAASRKNQTKK